MDSPTTIAVDAPGVANSLAQATSHSIVAKLEAAGRVREEATPELERLDDVKES